MPRKEKITPSESKSDIFRVLKKPSECKIGLFFWKIENKIIFGENISKNVFLFLIVDSGAHRHPLRP